MPHEIFNTHIHTKMHLGTWTFVTSATFFLLGDTWLIIAVHDSYAPIFFLNWAPLPDRHRCRISKLPHIHTRIYPQTFHPTLAPMTEHGHQNLSLMNEKLKFLHIYTRCFLDGIIPIQNNSTPFSSILNYETLNHKSVKEKDL